MALRRSDEETLPLEERRFARELEQRNMDGEERRIDREGANELESEKFKIMMEAFTHR